MTLVVDRHGQITAHRLHDLRATMAGFPAYTVGNALFVLYPVGSDRSGWCIQGQHRELCHWVGCGCDCHKEAS